MILNIDHDHMSSFVQVGVLGLLKAILYVDCDHIFSLGEKLNNH